MKQTPRIQAKNLNITLNFFAPEAAMPTHATSIFATESVPNTATPPAIGTYWLEQGGVYVGVMRGEDGRPDYHLVVAQGDNGENTSVAWGSYGEDEPHAKYARDGLLNTTALTQSDNDHPAALWAANLDIEGHSDWYLPSRFELALCYTSVPELFAKEWHLSSTQYSPDDAWIQGFVGGSQYGDPKDVARRARAVRRVINTSTL
ncbi:DUF1566 domain-containing protein [Pseudomonas extremaustralis]|uniref:DUF1566 domain-containing protein n=1 Tax=Pseudomonas extremaustralis TaxID=359110 RepID=UPI00285BBC9B|nr:DUF1566 domain-containing protein [Pseudomonas extremaustralis]MDR6580137.1 hypothetical protein [Pseudomonas extremaustralis]